MSLLRLLSLLGLLTIAAASAPATAQSEERPSSQSATIDVKLTPKEITVGDRIEARLMLIWEGDEPAATPRFPSWDEGWGDAEVLEAGPVEAVEGPRRIYRQEIVLTAFRPGEILLPEVTVEIPLAGGQVGEATIPRTLFFVRAILPELIPADPRPAADPKPLPGGFSAPDQRAFVIVTAIQLALCALVWGYRRRVRIRTASPIEEPRSTPIEIFDQRLSDLRPDDCEPAHFGLSTALRAFLGERLGFPALESTTREMPRRLRETGIPKSAADTIARILRECDEVKFAKRPVGGETTRDRLVEARKAARDVERHVRRLEIEAAARAADADSQDADPNDRDSTARDATTQQEGTS